MSTVPKVPTLTERAQAGRRGGKGDEKGDVKGEGEAEAEGEGALVKLMRRRRGEWLAYIYFSRLGCDGVDWTGLDDEE